MSVPGSRAVLPLLVAPPTGPLFDALDDGEPGRALELLPGADLDPTQAAGVRDLADELRTGWGPGHGSYYPAGLIPSMPEPRVLPDPVAHWWGRTLPSLVGLRLPEGPDTDVLPQVRGWCECWCWVGGGPAVAVQVLVRVAASAREHGRPGVAAALLADAGRVAEQPGAGAHAGAAVLLAEGDARLFPVGSPEALGYDPEKPTRPRQIGDRDAAEAHYRRAAELLPDGSHERTVLAVRRGAVAEVRGRPDEAVAALAEATERASGADRILLSTHLVRARVLAGELSAAHPGPVEEIAAWAQGPGSPSFAQGCVALLGATGHEAQAFGRLETARVLLGPARRAATRLGAPATELELGELLAGLYVAVHATDAATAVLEDSWARWAPLADDLGPIRQYTWLMVARLAAGLAELVAEENDPRLVRSLAARVRQLGAAAPAEGNPWPGDHAGEVLAAQRTALETIRRRLTIVTALANARMNEQRGFDDIAVTGYDRALTAAGDDVPLALLVLAVAGRTEELATRLSGPAEASGEELALYWRVAGRPDEAFRALERAGTVTPPDGCLHWEPFALRAEIALGRGHPDDARAFAGQGLARFVRALDLLPYDAWRVSVMDTSSVRRLQHVAVLAAADPAEALRHADRTRSLALGALVAEALDRSTFTPAVRERRTAEAGWNGAFDRRRSAWRRRTPGDDDTTAADLDAAESALDAALTAAPERPAPLSETDAARVAAALDPDMLLLHLTATEDELVTVTLTRDTLDVARHPIRRRTLFGTAARVHAAWSDGRAPEPDDLPTLAAAVLEPSRALLDEHPRLLVVPDGPLNQLPFAALELGGEPLLRSWAVSQLPAAGLVPHLAGRRRPRLDRGTLVVGDPGTGPDALPGARVEARAVARAIGTTPVLGDDATEDVVRGRLEAEGGLVHLATHGLLDVDAPDLTALLMARGDRLTVAELLGLRIDADLAVLSACDTGRGEITQGGDVVGLARGMLAAGAHSAVVTTWLVDDVAACLVMTGFAGRLAAGEPTAEALAGAQREVRGYATDERSARYAELAEDLGDDTAVSHRSRRRALSRPGEPMPAAVTGSDGAHPYWWAPFVHVGV